MGLILILTSTFPFPGGEQFLESEIVHWSDTGHVVVLVPASVAGEPRLIPPGLVVDTSLAKSRTRYRKSQFILTSIGSRLFRGELAELRRRGQLRPHMVFQSLKAVAQTRLMTVLLQRILRRRGPAQLVYSYWNDVTSFAAAGLKVDGQAELLVARAHRSDLYEETRPGGYIPVKRQVLHRFDLFLPISTSGERYLQDRFAVDAERISVQRLGVRLPPKSSWASGVHELKISSVSNCIPVKRIDRIIEALALAATEHPEVAFEWTHVGDGPLLTDLENLALERLGCRSNVTFSFLGELSNRETLNRYLSEAVDVFVNTSDSEGIPVSIMEAMAAGIPVIASDVGGVREIVNAASGWLLSGAPGPEELAGYFGEAIHSVKAHGLRSRARSTIADSYDAERNYPELVDELISLIPGR